MAAGGNDIGNIRNSPPVTAHVLYGAVVGGPLESDKFWDYRDDWVTNEIAIDYNAPLVALAAMMVGVGF
jgi:endoglucanase